MYLWLKVNLVEQPLDKPDINTSTEVIPVDEAFRNLERVHLPQEF